MEDRMSEESKVLLVVEDDEGLQRQLKWAYDGYEVICAGDRAQAIKALRAHEPAVVTLDLGLPPVKRIFNRWLYEADLVLGLFPDWFGPPQPDWPEPG